MKSLYNLAKQPANYNFIEFLVIAATKGADEIVLDNTKLVRKYSTEDTLYRIDNILIPACALMGLPVSYGISGEPGPYHPSAVLRTYLKYGHIKKLKSILPHGKERYTVTLRGYDRAKERNSNREAWERFASDIGAYVIEDYYTKPIHLHERMALYAGAEMNFSVANGPASLCYYSDAPFMGFWKNVCVRYHQDHDFPVGSQLKWLNPNQSFVWEDDTYDNISRAWEKYQKIPQQTYSEMLNLR